MEVSDDNRDTEVEVDVDLDALDIDDEERRLYWSARAKRPPGFQRVRKELVDSWGEATVLIFLGWFRTFLHEWLETPGARLPCSWYWVDIGLHWLIFLKKYLSQVDQERAFQTPQSSYGKVINWCFDHMIQFPQIFLTVLTPIERRQLTRRWITSGEMYETFHDVTVSWDGTHREWDHRTEDRDIDDFSYKMKTCAYNVLLIGHPIGWWYDVGEPKGAAKNDISLLQYWYKEIGELGLHPDLDMGICDRVFVHAIPEDERHIDFVYGHRKLPGVELTPAQKRENAIVSDQRGGFERHIGDLCRDFEVYNTPYRHPQTILRLILLNTLAISNIKKFPEVVRDSIFKEDSQNWEERLFKSKPLLSNDVIAIRNQRQLKREREQDEAYSRVGVLRKLEEFSKKSKQILDDPERLRQITEELELKKKQRLDPKNYLNEDHAVRAGLRNSSQNAHIGAETKAAKKAKAAKEKAVARKAAERAKTTSKERKEKRVNQHNKELMAKQKRKDRELERAQHQARDSSDSSTDDESEATRSEEASSQIEAPRVSQATSVDESRSLSHQMNQLRQGATPSERTRKAKDGLDT
eukprot:TRINITY_DN1634_c0_g2_i1.p1 TRINITY_DN1634_c0_g2~~TRINITY_DN1634_c0_g2_i1.p1  ORF type:complete len:581 (-),score=115.11 TRINITY_DN1634_c0_g2_i1:49-1791(-)